MIHRITTLLGAALLAVTLPQVSTAHHSVAGFFDPNEKVEIEGVVSRIRWRNPHTVFMINVTEEDGSTTEWMVESGALGVLRSRGLAREFVNVGDYVKILGDKPLRNRPETFARNMLLASGDEVLLTVGSRPHFSTETGGDLLESEFDPEVIANAKANADGIFRVWSDSFDRRRRGGRMFTSGHPLTAEAKAIQEQYDSGEEYLLGCTDWTMPRLMANPLPMEFTKDGDTIIQQFEENDERRVIHMNADATVSGPRTRMGFSKGRWEDGSLVVETTHVTPERLDNLGTPFGEDMHLIERFTLSDDETRLDYTIVVTDPFAFTEPYEQSRYWTWRPEIVVGSYACDEDQKLQ